jgi:hypothetical protein
MSRLEVHMPREHAKAGVTQACDPADIAARQVALRLHHRERLTRLFRHIGDSADDHYLLGIVHRYRGIGPS